MIHTPGTLTMPVEFTIELIRTMELFVRDVADAICASPIDVVICVFTTTTWKSVYAAAALM